MRVPALEGAHGAHDQEALRAVLVRRGGLPLAHRVRQSSDAAPRKHPDDAEVRALHHRARIEADVRVVAPAAVRVRPVRVAIDVAELGVELEIDRELDPVVAPRDEALVPELPRHALESPEVPEHRVVVEAQRVRGARLGELLVRPVVERHDAFDAALGWIFVRLQTDPGPSFQAFSSAARSLYFLISHVPNWRFSSSR